MAEILLTEGHNGGAVTAKVGDTLIIQLPENPTTGFRWSAAVADPGSLALTGDAFEPGGQLGVGGGGLRRWRFEAKRPSRSGLEFRLARTWESGVPKAVFRVEVQVS